jgi:hypothetical protein
MRKPVNARQALLGGLLLATFASFDAGCSTKDSLIVVTAVTADENVIGLKTLVVSAGTTQQTFDVGEDVAYASPVVGLYVPSSLTGRNVVVTAKAVSKSGCAPGYSGTATVNIPSAGSTVDVTVVMNDATTCPSSGGTGGSSGTGGTGAKGGTTGTGGTGAKGGSTGTGGVGGSTGGSSGGATPDFSRCTEIDHGTPGTCATCTTGTTTDVSVYGVAVSPNGATVVTGGTDGRVKIWSNSNGTLTAQGTPLSGTGLGAVAFSPDGSLLAIGRIGGVDIVSTSTWTVIRTLQTATSQEAYAVGFSPDSTNVFTISAPSGGGVTGALFAHAVGNVQSLAVQSLTSPWGMAVAPVVVAGKVPVAVTDGNGNATVYSWSPNSFGTPVVLKVTSDASIAEGAAFSPGGTVFAAGGDDGILSLWNYPAAAGSLPDGQINIYAVTQNYSDYIGAVAFSPTYGFVIVGASFFGSLTAYSLTDGAQVGVQYDTLYDVLALTYSPTSNLIVGGELDCGCVVVCPQ